MGDRATLTSVVTNATTKLKVYYTATSNFTELQVCQGFLEQYNALAAVAFRHVFDISPVDLWVRLEVLAHFLPERLRPVVQGGKSSKMRVLFMVFFHLHFFQQMVGDRPLR